VHNPSAVNFIRVLDRAKSIDASVSSGSGTDDRIASRSRASWYEMHPAHDRYSVGTFSNFVLLLVPNKTSNGRWNNSRLISPLLPAEAAKLSTVMRRFARRWPAIDRRQKG
jgi:hypothetical protein